MREQELLPVQFEALQKYVPIWAKDSVDERIAARGITPMQDIREFYDAAIAQAADILSYLEPYPLDELRGPPACLMKLLLGLAQASVAVEIQGQPLPPKASYPSGVHLISGVSPFG